MYGLSSNDLFKDLSEKQRHALRLVQQNKNIFITGGAGTGKSHVLKRIIFYLQQIYFRPTQWVVLGPTGTSAIALGGQTIHSYSGIGVPKVYSDFKRAWERKKQWRDLRTIVIDEVSMISGEFFDCLSDVVCDIADYKDKPFGGIQLIVCGDFLQLPPIPPRDSDVQAMKMAQKQAKRKEELFLNRGFAFQADGWRDANFTIVELDQVFRQDNPSFIQALNEIRLGVPSSESLKFLERCNRKLHPSKEGIAPTILYSYNRDVAAENLRELEKLQGEAVVYSAYDQVDLEEEAPIWAGRTLWSNHFFTNCIADKTLRLKVGAQVMLLKNEMGCCPRRLVNGSRGQVIGFEEEREFTQKNRKNEPLHAVETFLPFVSKYPVVQFLNGSIRLIKAQQFTSRLVGLGECIRNAVPLKLASAITTHKSQGMTLDSVVADVGGAFLEGQVYVALSRASNENGLELRNFSAQKVQANSLARSFCEDPSTPLPSWKEEAAGKSF